MSGSRTTFKMLLGVGAITFVGLSAYGHFFSAPSSPLVRLTACAKGIQPGVMFGAGMTFGILDETYGPDDFRRRLIGISWPGGMVATVIKPACKQADLETDDDPDAP